MASVFPTDVEKVRRRSMQLLPSTEAIVQVYPPVKLLTRQFIQLFFHFCHNAFASNEVDCCEPEPLHKRLDLQRVGTVARVEKTIAQFTDALLQNRVIKRRCCSQVSGPPRSDVQNATGRWWQILISLNV